MAIKDPNTDKNNSGPSDVLLPAELLQHSALLHEVDNVPEMSEVEADAGELSAPSPDQAAEDGSEALAEETGAEETDIDMSEDLMPIDVEKEENYHQKAKRKIAEYMAKRQDLTDHYRDNARQNARSSVKRRLPTPEPDKRAEYSKPSVSSPPVEKPAVRQKSKNLQDFMSVRDRKKSIEKKPAKKPSGRPAFVKTTLKVRNKPGTSRTKPGPVKFTATKPLSRKDTIRAKSSGKVSRPLPFTIDKKSAAKRRYVRTHTRLDINLRDNLKTPAKKSVFPIKSETMKPAEKIRLKKSAGLPKKKETGRDELMSMNLTEEGRTEILLAHSDRKQARKRMGDFSIKI